MKTPRHTPRNLLLRRSLSAAFCLLYAAPALAAQPPADEAEEHAQPSILPTIRVEGRRPLANQIGRSRLTQENLDQIQADNVGLLLNILPGTSMSGSPRPGGQTLNIWGFGDSEDIKISIDGAAKNFERYQQGSVFIEPELLKQVTVDKGSFDVTRGNGGFGGAVKLESRDAGDFLGENERFGGLVKSSYHSNDEQWQHSGALFAQNAGGALDGLLYASVRRGHDIKQPEGDRFAYSASRQQSFLLKSNYRPADGHLLTLSALYGRHKSWEPFAAKRGNIDTPSQRDIARYGLDGAWKRKLVYREQANQSYSLKYRYTPEEQPLLDLTVLLTHAQTKQDDTRPENAATSFAGSFGNQSHTSYCDTGLEISNRSRFDTGSLKHNLLAGVQTNRHVRDVWMLDKSKLRNAAYNYGRYQPYYMPAGRQQQNSLYLQDEIRIGKWTLTPALRYDHIRNQGRGNWASAYQSPDPAVGHDYRSKTYRGWSPFFGITWQPADSALLFANVSRSLRAPVVDEQYEVQFSQSSAPATSRQLEFEKLTSVRVGGVFNWKNLLAERDSLQLRATLFHMKGKDEIFKSRGIFCRAQWQNGQKVANSDVCAQPIANYRNLPGYTMCGGEIEAYYDSRYWFAGLSYSFMRGKRKGSPRNPWFEQDTWMSEIPPRKATATFGVRVPQQGITLGWKAEFIRHQDRSPTDSDPDAAYWALPKAGGYPLHGLFAAWQPPQQKRLTVRLTVDNLFNSEYAPYLSERISGVGRNVKTSVSWQF